MRERSIPLLILLTVFLLMGCTGSGQGSTPDATVTAAAPVPPTTAAAAPTAGATAPAGVPEGSYQNPVFRQNFPDPGVLLVDGTYYGYATNGSGRNIQLARSTDLVHWELGADAMPSLPSWAMLGGSFIWAPEVIQIGEQFVMYYTARDKAADKQCIGLAVSDKPEGKFKDTRDAAFICQPEEGGSIDPSPFRTADGKLYLYWKNDGNCCMKPTYLYVQELAPDGLSLVGEPTQLVRNDSAWEGHLVEAPTMWEHEGAYYLFFSANDYGGDKYAVGYATCEGPTGPCQDAPENPILASKLENPPVIGPGHQTIVLDAEGEPWLLYHVWEISSAGRRTDRRFLWLDPLTWEGGKPVVGGPTTVAQPMP